jgi:hypothetical protein
MQTVLNPLVNVYQTQLEASRRFADAIFSGTEKMDRVVLDAVHRIFNQQLTLVQAMTSARDPQSTASMLQSKLLTRSPDDTMNYQKDLMRIFAEMQNDISKSLQDYIEQLGTNAASGAALPFETAQKQTSEAATLYNPVTSVFTVWESAFKEAAALAKKNMAGTRSAIEDATNRTLGTAAAFAGSNGMPSFIRAGGNGMENVTPEATNQDGEASERSAMSGDGEKAEDRRSLPSSGGRRKQGR